VAENSLFGELLNAGYPLGEVTSVNHYLVTVKGIRGASVQSMVVFENGDKGMIREVNGDEVIILNCDSETTPIGSRVVLEEYEFRVSVGESLLGRVVDPFGRPLDGNQAPVLTEKRSIFSPAPGIAERALLSDQLVSGVSIIDMLFPIVLGQRIAVLGDTKSGKTTFLLQLAANQDKTENIVVYVLIGKRRSEVDQVVASLRESGMLERSIVVVADIFSSLAQSYIAPYAGCAMAEHLWGLGKDVVIIYDDLSAHAKVYREISLLAEANPGRDSYPGDMFHAHSSLLERAGKRADTGKTLTALPVVLTPSDDITAYLPTSVMSITDGQLIFDLATFRQSLRPALNTALSVSRVGGRAQSARQKKITQDVFKKIVSFRQAQEFSHFGTDLSDESRELLKVGGQIQDVFRQLPIELYTILEQELMLQVVLNGAGKSDIDVKSLKTKVREAAEEASASDDAFNQVVQSLVPVAMADEVES
jgi:F-type H+-transporting ATPase subunit alpha